MQEGIAFTPQIAASGIARMLWLIPAVPVVASGVIAVLKQPRRKAAAGLAIGSLAFSLVLALIAFGHGADRWRLWCVSEFRPVPALRVLRDCDCAEVLPDRDLGIDAPGVWSDEAGALFVCGIGDGADRTAGGVCDLRGALNWAG